MKVLVIGASGHTGSYLVKQLTEKNYEVVAVMRGNRTPYIQDKEVWDKVKIVHMDRTELIESNFLDEINADVICDTIAFDLESVKKLVSKIRNNAYYIQIGSIWAYEDKLYLPVDEEHPKTAEQTYGREKGAIEKYLLDLSKKGLLRASVVHPGHISGKEWQPINPQGNLDAKVYDKIIKGEQIVLPYHGLETMQHVHAHDLATIIVACIEQPEVANGEAFIAVAEKALSLRMICEEMYVHYGKTPNIKYVDWDEFVGIVGEQQANITYEHVSHSPCCTVEKAKKLLGVEIKYSIMDIYYEYLTYQGK